MPREYPILEGGGIPKPYMEETEYKGQKVYTKLPFQDTGNDSKDYRAHNIDMKKTYPYLTADMSKEQIILEFLRLREINFQVKGEDIFNYGYSNFGNNITNFFMERERFKVKNDSGLSRLDIWNDLKRRRRLYELAYQNRFRALVDEGLYEHKLPKLMFSRLRDTHIRGAFDRAYKSQNQFKPYVARLIIDWFDKNKGGVNNVLDFSAGFGGRCIGAISLDKNYIGLDPNTNLYEPYRDMLNTLKPYYNSNANIIFNYGEDVDFSMFKYDFVITSPPYIVAKSGRQKELYPEMKEYDSNTFYTHFLLPVIVNILKHLPKDKWFCLNVESSIWDELRRRGIPQEDLKFEYKLKAKSTKKQDDPTRYREFFYCIKKTDDIVANILSKVVMVETKRKRIRKQLDVKGSGSALGDTKSLMLELKRKIQSKGQELEDEEYDLEDEDDEKQVEEVKVVKVSKETQTEKKETREIGVGASPPPELLKRRMNRMRMMRGAGLRHPNKNLI